MKKIKKINGYIIQDTDLHCPLVIYFSLQRAIEWIMEHQDETYLPWSRDELEKAFGNRDTVHIFGRDGEYSCTKIILNSKILGI